MGRFLLFLALLAGSVRADEPSLPPSVETAVQGLRQAFQSGDRPAAQRAFAQLIQEIGKEAAPQFQRFLRELGRDATSPEARALRRSLWEQYTRSHGNDPAGYIGLGDSAAGDDDIGSVLSYSRAIDLGAATPDAFYGRGLSADKAGDHELAFADARRALELDPRDARAAALAKLTAGRPSKVHIDTGTGETRAPAPKNSAVAALPAAAREAHGPRSPDAAERASALAASAAQKMRLGDNAAAAQDAERALALDPESVKARSLLAAAQLRSGDGRSALENAEAALSLDPSNQQALVTRSWAASETGDFRRALTDAEKALAADPMNAFAHLGKARALGGLGERSGMADSVAAAARFDPRFSSLAEKAASFPKDQDTELLFGGLMNGRPSQREPAKKSPAKRTLFLFLWVLVGGALVAAGLLHIVSPTLRERLSESIGLGSKRAAASGGSIEQFELGRVIATGGMGVVYEGVDKVLGRAVAVKKMRGEIRDDPALRASFVKEARLLAQLSHPNIVSIHTIIENDPDLYLVFEFVPGKTLRAELAKNGPLPLARIGEILRGVSAALSFAHGRGVIHRDLKLDNFMISDDGSVKVMDFGLARRAPVPTHTMASTVWGTPGYMSPEAEEGEIRVESDLYSLAVCLYELATGKSPFSGTPGAMYKAKAEGRFADPSSHTPGLPPQLNGFFKKALAPKPQERFRSAEEFLKAFPQ